MKILFVHKYDYYEPLGIMILSSFLKEKGHECELLDLKFEKDYKKSIERIKPDIIAYSITTNNWKDYHSINLELKKHYNFISIFGGPHCTFHPDFIFKEGVDILCRGEGEYPFLELVTALSEGTNYYNIENLWVKKGEEIFRNKLRNLISNLDELPFPDRELINKYKPYKKRSRIRTISSRGCPYKCSYCFNHVMKKLYSNKGNYIRQRTPQNLVDELKILKKKYNPKNFEFHDDIFILNKKWVQDFVQLYINEKIEIPFEVNIRVDLVDEEIAYLLKKAGCYSVQFGIESGNKEIRNQILKRNISDSQIISAAELFKKYKIKINSFNLVGIPSEKIEDIFSTIKLNAKCKVNYAMNSIFQPYPGTELCDYAIKMNYYNGDVESFDKNYLYGKSVIKSNEIKQIERLHYLFAFAVKLPFLLPIIKRLIKLPLNKLFQSLYFVYRAYSIIFIFRRITIKEILLSK